MRVLSDDRKVSGVPGVLGFSHGLTLPSHCIRMCARIKTGKLTLLTDLRTLLELTLQSLVLTNQVDVLQVTLGCALYDH